MIYAYGICAATAPPLPPTCRGLGGARVGVLQRDGLAAVYSRHRTLRPEPTPAEVLAHERIVEAVMARGPVLPLRFGTQLATEERLATALEERREELLRTLARVRDRVELGVRALPAVGTPQRAGGERSGRAYLLARAAEQQRRDRAVHDLHAPLAQLAAASVVQALPAPPALLAAAYLVDAERVAAFRAHAAALGAEHGELHVVVTGPWPPYNFATEGDA
ncbi:MAG: GvpL/GvpF family gas vesicle protein [Actinobacteria bacterium]|nr:GvpL/GvpF family gas vesicle protein [Actinomycetota bacterium]